MADCAVLSSRSAKELEASNCVFEKAFNIPVLACNRSRQGIDLHLRRFRDQNLGLDDLFQLVNVKLGHLQN